MSKIKSLQGKRILITSWSYALFGGAALNAVELAEQLVRFGMKPTFFSYDIEGPLRDMIEEKFNTKVLTDQVHDLAESDSESDMGNTKIDINDFDYIWVGGNTLPISIINQINMVKKLPKFIFIHMSPLPAFPLDAPLMPELERRIASSILSISSITTEDCIKRILGGDVKVDYWKNPVPNEFKDVPTPSGKLRKVAVISSSHPSDEIMGIQGALESKDITVEYVGKFNDNVKVVNADFYSQYDLIIGIGKDARYALVSGVPIYVYGRFGGCGYLSDKNIEKAEAYNLSGRGFNKKDVETIAKEIVDGYGNAFAFHQENKDRFAQEMTMGNVAAELFTRLESEDNKTVSFDDTYIKWLVSSQINIMQRMKISHARRYWSRKFSELKETDDRLRKELDLLIRDRATLRDDIANIKSSTSWKVTEPLRKLGKIRRLFIGGKNPTKSQQ